MADQTIDTLTSESTEDPVAMTAKGLNDTSSALAGSPTQELLHQFERFRSEYRRFRKSIPDVSCSTTKAYRLLNDKTGSHVRHHRGRAQASPTVDTGPVQSNLLSPEDVCRYLGGIITAKTLANWRANGIGPQFVRLGKSHARIGYRRTDLDEFIATKLVN